MRKLVIGCLFVVLTVTGSISIYAAPGRFHERYGKFHERRDYHERENCRYIIHRTAMTVFAAQRATQNSHRYGSFAQAITHQQKARELYFQGSYREAIFHSLRAREIAIRIIGENRGQIRREYFRDEMEERYTRDIPRDEELDRRLDKVNIGSDDEAVHLHFDIDISN